MNVFMDSRNIQIRLIRKDQTDPESDDRIAIETQGENLYTVYYKPSDFYRTYHELQLSGEELDVYIHSLLILLANDRDAFESVQFLLPGFPSILFQPKDLKKSAIGKNLQYLMPLLTSVNRVRIA
jgi:hypothetical protein